MTKTATVITGEKELERAIGAKVRELREEQGFKKSDFATRCGISRAYLDHIEAGSQSPTIGMLNKVACALNVHLSELLPPCEAPEKKKRRSTKKA